MGWISLKMLNVSLGWIKRIHFCYFCFILFRHWTLFWKSFWYAVTNDLSMKKLRTFRNFWIVFAHIHINTHAHVRKTYLSSAVWYDFCQTQLVDQRYCRSKSLIEIANWIANRFPQSRKISRKKYEVLSHEVSVLIFVWNVTFQVYTLRSYYSKRFVK